MFRLISFEATVLAVVLSLIFTEMKPANDPVQMATSDYFPPPESKGGWRKLEKPDDIRRSAGMDPKKLAELRDWLLKSDERNFAALVICNGYIVLEVERGNSSKTDSRRVASVSKAICATVLAIASEESRHGRTPKKMTFDDPAFDFIPWAKPLSDPRKAKIAVKQLLNHTSGICPEATGARNEGPWRHVLGHDGDPLTAKLAFDPGTRCGYSTFALYHAALVCEDVTGKPYDQFAIDALFKPIGCEHWSFEYFEGGGKDGETKYGRHASHSIGMPARDFARIAYCMIRDGRWENRQVIPKWFVEETAAPTHEVKGPEMRFQRNAQSFSHGWELPARLTGQAGPSGQGIPKDARYKPGSGGQLIAFVPSMDLVVTRQTGSSGPWEYEEYLRRAVGARISKEAVILSPRTRVSIVDGRWHINGSVTYPGSKAEGLLMNVRMVNSVFEDPEKPEFDPETNTEEFIRRIPDYVSRGTRGFTICLQGGFPGYEGAVNSAFERDGSLRRPYLNRAQRVIEACDRHGVVIILGCYYQRQDQILKDEEAVRAGVVNVVKWIKSRGYTNVVLEIANEFPHSGFDHPILRTAQGEAELMGLAKRTAPDLLVSTSGIGDGKLPKEVAEASDFLLIHFNGVSLADIPERINALKKFGKPVVCNEDDKSGEQAAKAAELAVSNGASWGLMLEKWNQHFPFHFQGSADDPVAYAKLKELTSR
jgi:CubicO group peptidase (beta-lactamase class C family)